MSMSERAYRPTTSSTTAFPNAAKLKRLPPNPRFANVQPRLDTGMNMRKVLEMYQGTSGPNAHKKKKDEFFVRLRPTTLGRLLEPLIGAEESVYQLGRDDVQSVQSVVPESVPGGSSEGNILILDIRSFEKFEQCHVYGARHYDLAQLSKSTNNFPREMYFFKGPVECDKMVVLYDDDGKTAPRIGNQFVEKGIENTYVVSGGFLGLCHVCPEAIVGDLPTDELLAAMMASAGLKPSTGGNGSSMSARCSTAGSVRTQNTRLGTGSVAGSQAGGLRAWK